MDTILQDIRFGVRSLRKGWAVSLIAIISLALAIGGNGAVFSLVSALLFRPLPYENVEEIVLLWQQPEDVDLNFPTLSPAELLDFQERVQSFRSLTGFDQGVVNYSTGGDPEQVQTAFVRADLFDFLGESAHVGRVFHPEEDRPGQDRVVVLSYRFWEERFGKSSEVIGREVLVNSQPHTIVGVAEEDFELFSPLFKLFLPLTLEHGKVSRQKRSVIAMGRLKEGVSLEQARAEVESISKQLAREHPASSSGYQARLNWMQEQFPDPSSEQLLGMLQGAVLFVLLIACVNIANLLLARGQERQRELAVRSALGASRWRIVRQFLTESLVLAGLGALLGLGVAWVGIRLIIAAFGGMLPRLYLPTLDTSVLAFTAAITVAGGLLFGIIPAWQAQKVDIVDTLKESGRGNISYSRRFLTRGLVIIQVALALILLGGAGVLIRGFNSFQNPDLGFPAERLLTLQLSLPASRYEDPDTLTQLGREMIQRLNSLPGIETATLATALPRNPFAASTRFATRDFDSTEETRLPSALVVKAWPGYFETLEIPVLQGRYFDDRDRSTSSRVAVVSRSLARRYFLEAEALGEALRIDGTSWQIVGIVGDTAQSFLHDPAAPQPVVYLPYPQDPVPSFALLVRTRGEPHAMGPPIQDLLNEIDRDISAGQIMTLEEFVAQFFIGIRVLSGILLLFGGVAVGLAAIGIYGVLSYTVAQHTHEIGIRMAMGARQSQVLKLFLKQGLILSLIGFLLGIPGLLAVTYLISLTLSTFAVVQPTTVLFVGMGLFAVTLVASLLPAQRAARLDPLAALRVQ